VIAVPSPSETRTNLTITDRHGLTVKLNEVGAPLHKEELDRIEQVVEENLAGAVGSCFVECSSWSPFRFLRQTDPVGATGGCLTLLTRMARRYGRIEAGPTAVAPNQHETERLLSRALLTRNQFLEAALAVREMGAQSSSCRWVVVAPLARPNGAWLKSCRPASTRFARSAPETRWLRVHLGARPRQRLSRCSSLGVAAGRLRTSAWLELRFIGPDRRDLPASPKFDGPPDRWSHRLVRCPFQP